METINLNRVNRTKIKDINTYDLSLFGIFLYFYLIICLEVKKEYMIMAILFFITFIFFSLIDYKKNFSINDKKSINIFYLLPRATLLTISLVTIYNIFLIYKYTDAFWIDIVEKNYSVLFMPVNIINIISFLLIAICLTISILIIVKRKINQAIIYSVLPFIIYLLSWVIKSHLIRG